MIFLARPCDCCCMINISFFVTSAVGLKYCITHQLDPTNDISNVEEGEEAISFLASNTDVEQNLKCDSDPDQVNDDIKHEILQNCETIVETPNDRRNDKIANEK